jgi:hypothetical protein
MVGAVVVHRSLVRLSFAVERWEFNMSRASTNGCDVNVSMCLGSYDLPYCDHGLMLYRTALPPQVCFLQESNWPVRTSNDKCWIEVGIPVVQK